MASNIENPNLGSVKFNKINHLPRVMVGVVLILVLSVFSTVAQSEKVDCPQIRLDPPGLITPPEERAQVAVKLVGGSVEHSSISYDWYVSAGKIVSGQGKQAVDILTEEDDAGTTINVAVFVHGLPKECSASAVTKFGVANYPIGEPVVQFYDTRWGRNRYFLESWLDSYFFAITNNPGYEGFITIVFNEKDSLANKIAYLQRIYRHVAFRKFDTARLTFALAEYSGRTSTALWIMPPRAKMPKYARNYRIIKAENYRNRLNCIFPLD